MLGFAPPNLHGLRHLMTMKWLANDHKSFRYHLSQIALGNSNLEMFFESFKPPDPISMLENHTATDNLWPQIDKLRAALGDLHLALRKINIGNTSPPAAKFHLSMKLSQDPNRSRNDLEDHPNIAGILRKDSCVVHALSYVQVNQDPEMLSFESRAVSSAAANDRPRAPHAVLDSLSPPETQDQQHNIVEYSGAIRAHGPNHDDHLVFRTKAHWTRSQTLLDILQGDDYVAKMSPIQIVQLAQLVISAHLSYEDIRSSCAPVRPANLVFYERGEPVNQWNSADPLVLRPWLDFGFGRIHDARIPGDFGVADTSVHSNIELGLLLFQIGTGQCIDYGSSSADLMQARRRYLGNTELQMLRKRTGGEYVQAVQTLLEAEIVETELRSPQDSERERDHVKGVMTSFYALKGYLNGVATYVPSLAHAPEIPM
jgi:hypothetical protein